MVMTLEADYAVRIVEMLAISNQKIDARSISDQTHVPLRFALKILRKLVAGGLIVSYKGAHGGYMLAREPGKITLREVIESVEGPYMISRCQQDEYACKHTPCCRVHQIYDEISSIVRTKLDSYTFDCHCEDDISEKKDKK
ncbi:RrF2 family transcriptional regulator [Caproiciproducens faecalis]|uniref:Rrf2 family transcriptional regulator n=1 Tax=Caproiciproducens faecalis TaxID=2820301 RepID=A0ABS7DQ44_9FIRM|nr:Rrf2 family transcriptional regulator [Caproiciproducens faecalis]MBW7573431.1 Rrf2 family transcriptional regulator [Caproiciproducens faecalis]